MIILVGSEKGGVGKSTATVNIAAELQRQGRSVLLVEADQTVKTVSNWSNDRDDAGLPSISCVRKEGNLRSTLLDLDGKYSVVVVDVAGRDSKEMRTAMTAAHILISPLQPSQADLDTVESFVETIGEAKSFNPELRVLGFLNRASTNSMATDVEEARDYMKQFPEIPLAQTSFHERKAYKTCLEEGRGVVEMKDSKAAAEVQLLTQEILECLR